MKIFGGEMELKFYEKYTYHTDSGRSSLRYILNSISKKNMKILLPDFICPVIIDIVMEYNISYSFYKVNENFSINENDIKNNDFDILYLIRYFGMKNKLSNEIKSKINNSFVIIDSVFSPFPELDDEFKHYASYNSLRKIFPAAEGSFITSNENLDAKGKLSNSAPFIDIKYKAKNMKYEFINMNKYSETEYLNNFIKAESMLDNQKNIYSISDKGWFEILLLFSNIEKEKKIRKKNFLKLDSYLKKLKINIKSYFYSFYILSIDKREELKKFLIKKNIFIPSYWPNKLKIDNILYNNLLAIPVDSRYSESDMECVAKSIIEFYKLEG